jgi:hypothetical protein
MLSWMAFLTSGSLEDALLRGVTGFGLYTSVSVAMSACSVRHAHDPMSRTLLTIKQTLVDASGRHAKWYPGGQYVAFVLALKYGSWTATFKFNVLKYTLGYFSVR